MYSRQLAAAACLVLSLGFAAAEDAIITNYDPGIDCKIIEQTDHFVDYRCPGISGVDVWFSIGDSRWTVAFHPNEPTGIVLSQGFNLAHHPDLSIEWRFANGEPSAAIQRWRFFNGGDELDTGTFVVTKIDGDEVCHIALVDIAANISDDDEEAVLQMARDFADANAQDFSCENDPKWLGNPPLLAGHTHNTFR
ncbi:MAG: hypothetical protein COA52_13875 [Hyphomicrobiales bacterium]|nr:MAG: hypothetical protein COA52_13875 [Hyphomicrobiales bacterium]